MQGNCSLADFCDNFFISNGQQNGEGQIVYSPVPFHDRRPLIADITRSDGVRHDSAQFTLRPLNESVDFRGKKRLPIAALPNLNEKDEAIISIAKMRPCLILGKVGEVNPNLLPKGWQRSKALNAFDSQYLLAPVYSIATNHYPGAFGPVITARIKAAMYSEFFFLPQKEPVITNESILRLDRIFLSPLLSGIRQRDMWLSEEAMAYLFEQLFWMLGQEPSDEFLEMRQLLLEDLPTSAQ